MTGTTLLSPTAEDDLEKILDFEQAVGNYQLKKPYAIVLTTEPEGRVRFDNKEEVVLMFLDMYPRRLERTLSSIKGDANLLDRFRSGPQSLLYKTIFGTQYVATSSNLHAFRDR